VDVARLILVVNAGSTSLKLSEVDEAEVSHSLGEVGEASPDVVAVAHRIVHGGERFREPVVVDDEVESSLRQVSQLAPLHNGPAVEALERARRALPDVPHVAVFDTAFHATIPEAARVEAVPARWREEWGIRRYGFHGLSVAWSAERVGVRRLVVCHLGGGCSVSSVLDGRSVSTSMGFSPLDGIPMATRSGTLDPMILLHLLHEGLLDAREIAQALEHESGLRGLSGISGRVDELEASPEPRARLALDVFALRIAGAVAAAAVPLGGLDALVFTGGAGEHSPRLRAAVCARVGFLGVELDERANASLREDGCISVPSSAVAAHVVHAREDVVAARAARGLLGASASSRG
jgi:acetate kinase